MKLGVDFSNSHIFSVALANEKYDILSEVVYHSKGLYGSGFFAEVISKCLRIADADFDDVKEIVFARGPGSFTALRSLISYIKAVGYVKDIKLRAFLSLDWMALFTKEKLLAKEKGIKKIFLYLFSGAKDIFYFAEYQISEDDEGDIKLVSLSLKTKTDILDFEKKIESDSKIINCENFVDFELGAKYLIKLSSFLEGQIFTKENIKTLSPEYVFKPDFKKSINISFGD